MSNPNIRPWIWVSLGWWLLAGILIYFAPIPHGDMRLYLNEAHSMYDNGIYLATYRDSVLCLEKTPMLYWPLILIWRNFGINLLGVYIYTFTIGWINLFLTWWLAKQLRPDSFLIPWVCVLILIGNLIWPSFYRDLRFEGLVTLFGLLFLNIALKTLSPKKTLNWLWAGLCFGLCVFAKGLVAFIYYLPWVFILPYILAVPLDFNIWQWYRKMTVCILLGLIIPAAWLVYIYYHYGSPAIHYLLFSQVSNRVSIGSTNVGVQFLNLMKGLLPWTAAFALLLNHKIRHHFIKRNTILLMIILGVQLIFFDCFIRMHSPHYLIPMIPTTALLLTFLIELIPFRLKLQSGVIQEINDLR